MSYVATALTVIGTAVNAYGSYTEGQSAERAAEYNAKISEMNADVTMQAGLLDATRYRKDVRS